MGLIDDLAAQGEREAVEAQAREQEREQERKAKGLELFDRQQQKNAAAWLRKLTRLFGDAAATELQLHTHFDHGFPHCCALYEEQHIPIHGPFIDYKAWLPPYTYWIVGIRHGMLDWSEIEQREQQGAICKTAAAISRDIKHYLQQQVGEK